MMKPNLIVRVVTLSGFTILMSGFVVYKAGAFGGASDANPNVDSPGKDSAHAPVLMAPSSKSDVIFEPMDTKDSGTPKQNQQQQSNQRDQAPNQNAAPPKTNEQNNSAPAKNVFMGSSKSAPVFVPAQKDTSKPK